MSSPKSSFQAIDNKVIDFCLSALLLFNRPQITSTKKSEFAISFGYYKI